MRRSSSAADAMSVSPASSTIPATAADAGDALRVRWAAERTLLAWVRTSLALFGLGFVMARLVMTVDAGRASDHSMPHVAGLASIVLGVVFVFVGAAVSAAAAWRYRGFLVDAAPVSGLAQGSTLSFAASLVVSVLGLLLAMSLVAMSL